MRQLFSRFGNFGRLLPNGHIEFVGRVDDLVKIRGFRVELGEIARTIRQHPEIKMFLLRRSSLLPAKRVRSLTLCSLRV